MGHWVNSGSLRFIQARVVIAGFIRVPGFIRVRFTAFILVRVAA